jgi:hypothetical protein
VSTGRRARAVEKPGQTMAGRGTAPRPAHAATRGRTTAIRRHGVPEKRTLAGRAAQEATRQCDKAAHGTALALRQITALTTLVAPAPRGGKRVPRPRLGGTACAAAQATLGGIERRHRSKPRPRRVEDGDEGRTTAEQFAALAASSPHRPGQRPLHDLLRKMCDTTVSASTS